MPNFAAMEASDIRTPSNHRHDSTTRPDSDLRDIIEAFTKDLTNNELHNSIAIIVQMLRDRGSHHGIRAELESISLFWNEANFQDAVAILQTMARENSNGQRRMTTTSLARPIIRDRRQSIDFDDGTNGGESSKTGSGSESSSKGKGRVYDMPPFPAALQREYEDETMMDVDDIDELSGPSSSSAKATKKLGETKTKSTPKAGATAAQDDLVDEFEDMALPQSVETKRGRGSSKPPLDDTSPPKIKDLRRSSSSHQVQAPAKRGRGRPRKRPVSVSTTDVQMQDSEDYEDTNHSAAQQAEEPIAKRTRGGSRKRMLPRESSPRVVVPAPAQAAPAKRGRGRPRKNHTPQAVKAKATEPTPILPPVMRAAASQKGKQPAHITENTPQAGILNTPQDPGMSLRRSRRLSQISVAQMENGEQEPQMSPTVRSVAKKPHKYDHRGNSSEWKKLHSKRCLRSDGDA